MRIILKRKGKKAESETEEANKPWTFGESIKADVRLKLLKQRFSVVNELTEPERLEEIKRLLEENAPIEEIKKVLDQKQSLAAQLFQVDFVAGLGQRMGDGKSIIGETQERAWERLLLKLKIAERKYGVDHPWTQLLFEVCCNVLKGRLYRSVRSEDTKVEVVEPPPEFFMNRWWSRKDSLRE